jgi:hypothetical protein
LSHHCRSATPPTPPSSIRFWTEKVRAVSDLDAMIDAMTKAGGMTLLMRMQYVSMAFPKGRAIDMISMQFKEWSGSGNALHTSRGKDLTVLAVAPMTQNLLDLAHKQHGVNLSLDAPLSQLQTVTLTTKQPFTKE